MKSKGLGDVEEVRRENEIKNEESGQLFCYILEN